jgi:glutathione S-transferase
MLTIYGVARSRASRIIWLAKELGLPFELVPVIQANRLADPDASTMVHTKSPEFLAVNPMGQIPSVVLDGETLHQSLAVNLILARRTGGPLAPADMAEEAQMLVWTLWAAADMEPHAIEVLYHGAMYPPEKRDPAKLTAAVNALKPLLAVLDAHLTHNGGHMVGGRFTVADINVAEVVRYAMPAKDLMEAAPAVRAWLGACHARAGYRQMMAMRDAEVG